MHNEESLTSPADVRDRNIIFNKVHAYRVGYMHVARIILTVQKACSAQDSSLKSTF